MKNLFLTVLFVAIATFTFGQSVVGTPHDLAAAYYAVPVNNGVCGSCHTPHNAVSTLVPLWSHTTSVAAFTMYSNVTSSTYQGTNDAGPSGPSLACLSCHDGTVGIDQFLGGDPIASMIAPAGLVGIDLTNDHPVSFTYNTALATLDGELEDPSVALSGLGGTINADMLFNNRMQCSSCHDVHNNVNTNFQLMANTNSELCLTCHIK